MKLIVYSKITSLYFLLSKQELSPNKRKSIYTGERENFVC